MARVSFDTSFLIDFQRERRAGAEGPAHLFLKTIGPTRLCLSAVALAEFAEGFSDIDHEILRLVRETHEVLPIDESTALVYAEITRELRRQGRLIGANDLWIAATALANNVPIVSGDTKHFLRVPGLDVRAYRN